LASSMSLRRKRWIRPCLVGVLGMVALAGPSSSARADTCSATDGATLTTALTTPTCTTVNLSPGPYTSASAFNPDHSVTINGAGAATTTLTRTAPGTILALNGSIVVSISGVTITGAVNGSGASVFNTASLSISKSVVTGNSTNFLGGGGILNNSSSPNALTVNDTVISNNSESANQGGGVTNSSAGTVRFNRVLFSGNDSTGNGGGGAFSGHVTGGSAKFTNVTFYDNHADGDGGALRIGSTTPADLNNVTVAFNVANQNGTGNESGGGISVDGGTVTLRNSIVAGNSVIGTSNTPDCVNAGGSLIRQGYDLIADPTNCTFGGTGDTTTGFLTGDPMIPVSPSSNGGFSETLPLLTGSQAIDAGNPATPGSGGTACAGVDQRGLPRGGTSGVCDLGAFEVQGNHPLPPPASAPGTSTPTQTTTPTKKKCKKKKKKKKKKKHKRSAATAKKCMKKKRK
jgi:hypothetical protein